MTIGTDASQPLGLAVYEILREARANETKECRDSVRYAFFRPVVIHDGKHSFSGFSREVSETGMGLLHNAELTRGEVEITIPTDQGYSVRMRTDILWCAAIGEGWYISGGRFLGIAGIQRDDEEQ